MVEQTPSATSFRVICPRLPSRLSLTLVLSYAYSYEKATSRLLCLSKKTREAEKAGKSILNAFCIKKEVFKALC